MTRKEGILRNWHDRNPGKMLRSIDQQRLLAYEYRNYTELCEYCGESPAKIQDWINQTITPKTAK